MSVATEVSAPFAVCLSPVPRRSRVGPHGLLLHLSARLVYLDPVSQGKAEDTW